MDDYANQVEKYLQTQNGVTNIDKSIKPGTSKITFIPDQAKMAENGISMDQVAFALRTFASGFKLSELKFDQTSSTQNDITLRFGSETPFTEDLGTLMVPSITGELIPLTSLGSLELKSSPTLISREEAKRTISVTASVKKGY